MQTAAQLTDEQLHFQQISEKLCQLGWSVSDRILPLSLADSLLRQSRIAFAESDFEPAGIASGQTGQQQRGDFTCWIDEQNASDAQKHFMQLLDRLKNHLNQQLFMGLIENEMHAVVYPPGGFYRRHLDNRQNSNRRILTWILYLNPQYLSAHGGQLRLYTQTGFTDIEPLHNRLVCFLSDRFEHEVLPTQCNRFSLTGWYGKPQLVF